MLLHSQLPHGGLVVDLRPGPDCSPVLRCHHNSHGCTVLSNILSVCYESMFLQSLRLDPSPVDMLFCCYFCSNKYQSRRTEHLSSPPLLSLVCFPVFFCSFCFIPLLQNSPLITVPCPSSGWFVRPKCVCQY